MKNFWQIIVLILLVSVIGIGVAVWQPWKTSNRTIQTSGTGKIKATPDVAKINGGIEIKKPTANEAQTIASETISKIVTAVKEMGIEEKDIKTENISTGPNYTYTANRSEVDGYISRATITVTVRDITKGQAIVDLVVKNGGTNVYGPNLSFSDEKMEELKNQARDKAVTNAREKADQLAKSSNTKVKKAINIVESDSGNGPIPYLGEIAMDSAKSSSLSTSTILPGESEVTVNVSVTFSIR